MICTSNVETSSFTNITGLPYSNKKFAQVKCRPSNFSRCVTKKGSGQGYQNHDPCFRDQMSVRALSVREHEAMVSSYQDLEELQSCVIFQNKGQSVSYEFAS